MGADLISGTTRKLPDAGEPRNVLEQEERLAIDLRRCICCEVSLEGRNAHTVRCGDPACAKYYQQLYYECVTRPKRAEKRKQRESNA